jgi:1-acyl-sn-glycerol-3-phosphate acyltransferase
MLGFLLKLSVGVVFMAITATAHALVLLVLAPSRNLRIRSCNLWGWFVGRACVALTGCTLTVRGREHLDGARPAIYISNHTSALDIFLGIWQAPLGTVGVAKKEVVRYPFFGQLYCLSGHLRVDRGHTDRAIASMRELAAITRAHHLSIWMWPEGTRSPDGRLLPFKKGLYHLAVETGLPIVPVVVSGAHHSWPKGQQVLRAVPIDMEVLPALDTSHWAARPVDEVLAELRDLFAAHLPEDQRPAPEPTVR